MSIQSVKGFLTFPLHVTAEMTERPHLQLDCQREVAQIVMVDERSNWVDNDVRSGMTIDFPLAGADETMIAEFLYDNRASIEVVMLTAKIVSKGRTYHSTADLSDCEPHLTRLQNAVETFRYDRVGTGEEVQVFTLDMFREIVRDGGQEEARDHLAMSDYELEAAFEDCAEDNPVAPSVHASELREVLLELVDSE